MHISSKCSLAVHCLVFIYEYGEQTKVTSELLSLSTGSNPVIIRNLLSALKKDGILTVRPGTGGATLCCPPQEITLYRIYKAIEPDFAAKLIGVHPRPSPFCPVGRNIRTVLGHSYEKVQKDLCESLQNVTLADVLNDYHIQLDRETAMPTPSETKSQQARA